MFLSEKEGDIPLILLRGLSGSESVIIQVITKLNDCEVGVPFVNHEYDYRLTSADTKSTYQLIIKITISEKHKK